MGDKSKINSELLAALVEILDIIDQGDLSEVWQVALMKARAIAEVALRETAQSAVQPTEPS